jgi:Amidohydrolase
MDQECPIADIKRRMSSANVSRALLVETWDGRNRSLLEDLISRGRPREFRIALCYHHQRSDELCRLVQEQKLDAIRISTADLGRNEKLYSELPRSEAVVVAHAEDGIGPLWSVVRRLYARNADLKFYLPHLAWPVRNGEEDAAWQPAIEEMAAIPSVTIGISAIAHFSNQPFPHPDVQDFAIRLLSKIPAFRVTIGSDYPLFEKDRYGDYVQLAYDWIASRDPAWTDNWLAQKGEG